jgi:hypothetical protein
MCLIKKMAAAQTIHRHQWLASTSLVVSVVCHDESSAGTASMQAMLAVGDHASSSCAGMT